jgi:hypothetical protein
MVNVSVLRGKAHLVEEEAHPAIFSFMCTFPRIPCSIEKMPIFL